MRIVSLASGSSANATLIESEHTRILIDAGLSRRQIVQRLTKVCGANGRLDAILVTHEHQDHIVGLERTARAFEVPIYATEGTIAALEPCLEKISKLDLRVCVPRRAFEIGDLVIEPFRTPHDAAESCGFFIEERSLFAKLNKRVGLATDLGTVTREVREYLEQCDFVLLESNHDVEMLLQGMYPEDLKARILSEVGHLSNDDCAETLVHLAKEGRLKRAVLMHLSQNNNRPKLALETAQRSLNGSVEVAVAPRDRMSEIFVL
ncbi:MAG: MBL fold metallo-hydrolase [Candidatus Bipolaricaulota bacterium]|nr:MBL fold metallo-hydrolase [Candidatus Bipolaricaulota bacterium]MCS7274472.1 MBL fold metallo-hydrolase [Candidatus Bipolaricaulota bacterium]MDW8110901.1 MBL fold metallo-hydrolase [Candidatus Bipolaricaulota bacterium]MDW8329332.1 MBL fold metallo-hydrolase [Candidatus Bipolaricaulota bacterium]